MTREVELSIDFENSQEVYSSGERVKGIVTTRVKEVLRAVVIKAMFVGCYRFKNEAGGFHLKKFAVDEVKLDLNGQVSDIAPGEYASPFCFKLDSTYPTSLQCPIGSILYKIIATCGYKLSGDSPVNKEEKHKCFSVIKDLDLNDRPIALIGVRTQHPSSRPGWLSCFSCQNEPLITMSTVKRAFVCGEKVIVNATIQNDTSNAISQTLIGIVQTVKTKVNRKCRQTVVKKERGMVMSHTNAVWMDESLTIPAVPPSSDDPFISVSYQLYIKLTRDSKKDILLKVPILIGNVPLDNTLLEANGIELSFLHKDENGTGDTAETFIPSYVVYRFCPSAPSAPMEEEQTGP